MINAAIPSIKIILHFQGEVLLLHAGGSWDLPGGRMEYGEHILDCLHRELREELGIDVHFKTEPKVVRVYDYTPMADGVHRLYVVYAYNLDKKIQVKSGQVQWLSSDGVRELNHDENWKQMILSVIS